MPSRNVTAHLQQQSKGSWSTAIVLALMIVLVWFLFSGETKRSDHSRDDGQSVVVEPDDSQGDGDVRDGETVSPGGLSECLLYAVFSKRETDNDIAYTATFQDDEFWREYVPSVVEDWEFIEYSADAERSDDPVAAELVKRSDIKPPFVMLFHPEESKPRKVIPLPKGGTDKIREMLK